jgi:hypothetical protein
MKQTGFLNLNKVVCVCVCGFLVELTIVYLLLFRAVCLCSETLFLVCVFSIAALLCDSPLTAVHMHICFMLQELGTSHLKE